MNSNQKKFGIGIVVALLCTVAFYFLYWVKTPTYSLNIIKESVEKHDVDTFNRHVDLDTLYTKAFDDAFIAFGKIEGENYASNPFFMGMLQMIKPGAVAALKANTYDYIKGEKSAESQNTEANKVAKNLSNAVNVESNTLKDVSVISKEGETAIVGITMHDATVDKDFQIKVKMTQLSDGKWKLVEMTNFADYLIELDKAKKEKIAELDKPQKEAIYKAVKPISVRGGIVNQGTYFPNYHVAAYITLENTSEKNIKNVTGLIEIIDKNTKNIYKVIPNLSWGSITKGGKAEAGGSSSLNEFIPKEKELITKTATSYETRVKVLSVEFDDGTKLERVTKLPELAKSK